MNRNENKTLQSTEIDSLNLDDLDVEELERRLELATLVPSRIGNGCNVFVCGTLACGTLKQA